MAELRHGEHAFSDRRRVADEDDTVLDDAHESSSAASQDRGRQYHDLSNSNLCAALRQV